MKRIRFLMSILYDYYSDGPTRSIAYIKTVGVMTLLAFVLLLDIFLLTNHSDLALFAYSKDKAIAYLKIILITLPIVSFFLIFFKKNTLSVEGYSEKNIKKGRLMMLLCFILIIISLPVILIFKTV